MYVPSNRGDPPSRRLLCLLLSLDSVLAKDECLSQMELPSDIDDENHAACLRPLEVIVHFCRLVGGGDEAN